MAETNSDRRVSITRLILVPGLVTLGVTILRLVGELQHWSKTLFNPAPGGGGGLVGIVDRKSTRLNSSHDQISYAVFCLKKKNHLPLIDIRRDRLATPHLQSHVSV